MLNMVKKKATHQFVFSTKDMSFDPATVSVIDTSTGKKLDVEVITKIVGYERTKIFAVRMTPDDLKRVRTTAKKVHINPSDFAREAIEKAIKEIEDDSERLEKNKR